MKKREDREGRKGLRTVRNEIGNADRAGFLCSQLYFFNLYLPMAVHDPTRSVHARAR